jgi:superfamily II DNA helicase RecQ
MVSDALPGGRLSYHMGQSTGTTPPADDTGEWARDLNTFLASHRVLNVRQEWVADGDRSYWAFSVDYAPGAGGGGALPSPVSRNARVDYKEVLSEADFAVYAKLRDYRKVVAGKESVPPFTVFTNEQLAAMVTAKCSTMEALREIPGIGEARASRHGAAIQPGGERGTAVLSQAARFSAGDSIPPAGLVAKTAKLIF